MPQFTYTEQNILDVLSDGLRHTVAELCLAIDKQATPQNLRDHICSIRKKMQSVGHDISCETRYKKTYYRHVLLINQGE